MFSYGFIGCGNMGGALARAVSKSVDGLAVADKSLDAANSLAVACGATVSSNEEIAKFAKTIVLGVKPQVLPVVMKEIQPVLSTRTSPYVIISMAAGVSLDTLATGLCNTSPILRIMPNMPASFGEGMIVYSANSMVSAEDKAKFEADFSKAGDISEIPESLMDAASAVSGCGPAFVYLFMESLADGGVRCGLPRDLALRLAAKTVSGSATAMMLSGKHPGQLKDEVCSPAGSTIEGVEALEKASFRCAVSQAVIASYERTKKLG